MASLPRSLPVVLIVTSSLMSGLAWSQRPAPPGTSLAAAAASRFPQSVRVGDLIGRTVLQPLESQPVLGHVTRLVRLGNGEVDAIIEYGGFLGIGARLIAVPIEAMALLGTEMEILDFTPKQLSGFPTYDAARGSPIADDEFIRVGLSHPSH